MCKNTVIIVIFHCMYIEFFSVHSNRRRRSVPNSRLRNCHLTLFGSGLNIMLLLLHYWGIKISNLSCLEIEQEWLESDHVDKIAIVFGYALKRVAMFSKSLVRTMLGGHSRSQLQRTDLTWWTFQFPRNWSLTWNSCPAIYKQNTPSLLPDWRIVISCGTVWQWSF